MYKDFNEYWAKVPVTIANAAPRTLAHAAFHAAREGMIPESEALRIPPVSEWPDNAKRVAMVYLYGDDLRWLHRSIITSFDRPADPGYKPQEGELVFFFSPVPEHHPFLVGRVKIVVEKEGVADIRTPGGNLHRVHFASIKPFNVNYIDAPDWESICPF